MSFTCQLRDLIMPGPQMILAGTQDWSTLTKYPAKWETTQDSTRSHFPFQEPRPHWLEEGVSWLHIPTGSASAAKGGVCNKMTTSNIRKLPGVGTGQHWFEGQEAQYCWTQKSVSIGLTLLHSSSTETPSLWWNNSLPWTPMTFQFYIDSFQLPTKNYYCTTMKWARHNIQQSLRQVDTCSYYQDWGQDWLSLLGRMISLTSNHGISFPSPMQPASYVRGTGWSEYQERKIHYKEKTP